MTWEELQATVARDTIPRDQLEKAAADVTDGTTLLRLARACVRDNRLVEALGWYDQAELLGQHEAHEERLLVARHVGDFPDRDGWLA